METKKRKSTAPFYAAAVVWLAYALLFPLYAPLHYALAAGAAVAGISGGRPPSAAADRWERPEKRPGRRRRSPPRRSPPPATRSWTR